MFMVQPVRMLPAKMVESSALGKVTALSSLLCDVGIRFEISVQCVSVTTESLTLLFAVFWMQSCNCLGF